MQELKEKLPVMIVVLLFLGVCGLAYYFVMMHTSYYFTQIDNTYMEQLTGAEYQYKLTAYDERGKMHDVTFKANKELREDAFLKLEMMAIRGVVNWEEVEYDELPLDVKSRYTLPETTTN